jgi:hypothetical protein
MDPMGPMGHPPTPARVTAFYRYERLGAVPAEIDFVHTDGKRYTTVRVMQLLAGMVPLVGVGGPRKSQLSMPLRPSDWTDGVAPQFVRLQKHLERLARPGR